MTCHCEDSLTVVAFVVMVLLLLYCQRFNCFLLVLIAVVFSFGHNGSTVMLPEPIFLPTCILFLHAGLEENNFAVYWVLHVS